MSHMTLVTRHTLLCAAAAARPLLFRDAGVCNAVIIVVVEVLRIVTAGDEAAAVSEPDCCRHSYQITRSSVLQIRGGVVT